jgi:hypothetical protein
VCISSPGIGLRPITVRTIPACLCVSCSNSLTPLSRAIPGGSDQETAEKRQNSNSVVKNLTVLSDCVKYRLQLSLTRAYCPIFKGFDRYAGMFRATNVYLAWSLLTPNPRVGSGIEPTPTHRHNTNDHLRTGRDARTFESVLGRQAQLMTERSVLDLSRSRRTRSCLQLLFRYQPAPCPPGACMIPIHSPTCFRRYGPCNLST